MAYRSEKEKKTITRQLGKSRLPGFAWRCPRLKVEYPEMSRTSARDRAGEIGEKVRETLGSGGELNVKYGGKNNVMRYTPQPSLSQSAAAASFSLTLNEQRMYIEDDPREFSDPIHKLGLRLSEASLGPSSASGIPG